MNEHIEKHMDRAIRFDKPKPLKTSNYIKNIRNTVRYYFAKFPVKEHIEEIWFEKYSIIGYKGRQEIYKLKFNIYFAVAQGQSVSKLTKEFLSKKETHRLVNCSRKFNFEQTMTWAVALTFTDDDAIASRLAHTKISTIKFLLPIYRDCIRFFSANPIPSNQINDLIDFILYKHHNDKNYNLKGRTVSSLEYGMKLWHKELRDAKAITGVFQGLEYPNWDFGPWKVNQIKTGKELVAEGSAMHHCVASYAQLVKGGCIGIFSMIHEEYGIKKRHLTIEVSKEGRVKQIRGFGNRLPKNNELQILYKWSDEIGVKISSYY